MYASIRTTDSRPAERLPIMPDAAHGVRLVGTCGSVAHIAHAAHVGGRVQVVATVTGPAVQAARQNAAYGFASLDWLARVCAPAWLDACGLAEMARILRELAPLADGNAARAAGETLRAAQNAAYQAAGIVVCTEVGADVIGVVDRSGAGVANGAAFHAVGREHAHPDAEAVGAAASYAYTVCQYAAHATAERKRYAVVRRVSASGVPLPEPATSAEVVEAVRREFGARRVEQVETVAGGTAAQVVVWFDPADVVTVARAGRHEVTLTPADLAAGTRPRAWDGVRVWCEDTTGARTVARFVAEQVDRLGCGCWRLRGERPGPYLPGVWDGMEVLTGCAVHPCGILGPGATACTLANPLAEVAPAPAPVSPFADLAAARIA
ncbi:MULTISPECIES: hypothetical protein [unclassified Micromonospora]|uniref:hypothetical protein n=1 Tax=unclassified Micromonospora TaxID=2617518 RepID=UPI00331CFD8E